MPTNAMGREAASAKGRGISGRSGGTGNKPGGSLLGLEVTGPAPYGTGGKPSGQGAGSPTTGKQAGSPLPQIADVPDNVVNQNPINQDDLTPLADAPTRKPVRSALGSYTGSVGITGTAGVFIP